MKIFKKTYWLIFPFIIFICLVVMDKVFNMNNFFITGGIAGAVGFILLPRKKVIKTQTGEKTQIIWLFFKKPIFID